MNSTNFIKLFNKLMNDEGRSGFILLTNADERLEVALMGDFADKIKGKEFMVDLQAFLKKYGSTCTIHVEEK